MSSTELEIEDLVASSPNLTRRMVLVFLAVLNVTLLAAIAFNAPLEEAANAAITPNPAKAPWYFVWLQELVASTTVHLGRVTLSGGFLGGILLPGLLLVVLAIWPWLDRSPRDAEARWFPASRRTQNRVFMTAMLAILLLIVVGVFLRGPNWRIYWPGTPRPQAPTAL
jgi:quinol-cytochrome oxidoreductase complex cytochrome b subunit